MKFSTISMRVSFDRTVYPLNSLMHVRISLDHLLPKESIYVEIYSIKEYCVYKKHFNPRNMKNISTDAKQFLYQIDIPMRRKKWKLGYEYVVIARHGLATTQDSMIIARRKSLILTDKSVYLLGSDAIISVISPDFDLDSQKLDVIGNKKNGKITISSSKGKLTYYKLVETEKSTGIFQGVVGFEPGSYTKSGMKAYTKPRGKGPADGYLPAEIGDKITITFDNEYESVKSEACISNFGAAIEMDKKKYSTNDFVYLTIVAPDFNYNSDKIDSIGDKPDNYIQIQTNLGMIQNYQLKETGKDTGIFTGKIRLVSSKISKKYTRDVPIPHGIGPNDGILLAEKNDKIKVNFKTRKAMYGAEAIIK